MPAPDKTEKPTAKRKRDARRDGSVAKSPEIASWGLILLASFVGPWVFNFAEPKIVDQFLTIDTLTRSQLTTGTVMIALSQGLRIFAEVAAIAGGIGFAFSFIATVAQTGVKVVLKSIRPQLKHLSPMKNVKRIFSSGGLFEVIKSFIKILVVSAMSYMIVHAKVTALASGQLSLTASIDDTVSGSLELLRSVAAVGLALGVADYFRQRHSLTKSLYMSKQEIKDESRESEGDPMVKGRIRRVQRQMARQRMLHLVPQADVVVVNPTHYAVAIKYDPQKAMAPVVIAKGSGHVALAIKRIANEHVVPIVRDPLLARTLHATCKIGTEIPPTFFLAVARLLAFVYRLSGAARFYETSHATSASDLPASAIELAEALSS